MRFKNRLEACNLGEGREWGQGSVIRDFRITAPDGRTYDTEHDNHSAIVENRLFVSGFDVEVMRVTRNDEGIGKEEGGAE